MDTAHWPHQDIGLVKPMEELIPSSSSSAAAAVGGNSVMARAPQQLMGGGGGERRVRPQKEQALNCPRCNSTNTKFCYYNNYSLTQPRYFCKTCRRYWTEGGSLRNVPVGGGSRKNKRSSSSSASSSAANASTSTSAITSSLATSLPTLSSSVSSSASKNPKFQGGQDLNLAFPALPEFGACTNAATATATNLSAMELLRSTGMQQGVRGPLNPFMPMHPMAMPEYPSGFSLQDFRASSLSFPPDHGGESSGYGAGGLQDGGAGRLLFPFEESRGPMSSNAGGSGGAGQFDQNNKGEPPGFWNGMMGGGGGGGGGGSW